MTHAAPSDNNGQRVIGQGAPHLSADVPELAAGSAPGRSGRPGSGKPGRHPGNAAIQ